MAVLACSNSTEFYYPVSDLAASFIPANQDSVLFTSSNLDSSYLIYYPYSTSKVNSDNVEYERIQQRATCFGCPFYLSYMLNAGQPEIDSVGKSSKTDVLLLASTTSTYQLNIGTKAISGNLYFLDSLLKPDSTYIFNVYTDSSQFFFTQTEGIVGYKNNNNWYFKTN